MSWFFLFLLTGISRLTSQFSCKQEKTKSLQILKFCHQNAVLACRKPVLRTRPWYGASGVSSWFLIYPICI